MFQIMLANRVIRIHPHFSYVQKQCEAYLTAETCPFDLEVEIPMERIREEQEAAERYYSLPYCESICVYREIALGLLRFQTMVLHGAVISCEGRGIAFLAKSGVGKSTHIGLWKQLLGEKVQIINGDKPLISWQEKEGVCMAYGTPWCGKEGWGCNASVPLGAICFLVRGKTNAIRPMTEGEVIQRLFHQMLMPPDEELLGRTMDLAEKLLVNIPFYELRCTMEMEAAQVAYDGLCGRKEIL